MRRIFSPLNILILVAVVAVAYLGYNHFSGSKEKSETQNGVEDKKESEESKEFSSDLNGGSWGSEQGDTMPIPEVVREQKEVLEAVGSQREATINMTKERVYKSQTYNFRLAFPQEWPLKVKSKKEIFFGYTDPRDGMGAIKLEIGEDLKAELQKDIRGSRASSGVEVKEWALTVDRVPATKYILIDTSTGDKDFHILVENLDFDYVIKYSNESPAFVGKSEQVVGSFRFTK